MTNENRNHNQAFVWLALLGSVALHALLLQVPGMRTLQPSSPPNALEVELVLVEQPSPEPDPSAQPPEPPPSETPTATTVADPPEPPTPEPDAPTIADQGSEVPDIESHQPPLGYRVLQQVHINHAVHEVPDQRNRLQGAPSPSLPGQVGWLNDHVGTVAASSDHWRDPDGGFSSRLVMANGQVVCGHIRPLTVSEMFNPALSLAVPMFRLCGRRRPEPVDRSDPWVRGSGSHPGSTLQDP